MASSIHYIISSASSTETSCSLLSSASSSASSSFCFVNSNNKEEEDTKEIKVLENCFNEKKEEEKERGEVVSQENHTRKKRKLGEEEQEEAAVHHSSKLLLPSLPLPLFPRTSLENRQKKREVEKSPERSLPPPLASTLPTSPRLSPPSVLPPLRNLPAPIPKLALPSFSQFEAAAAGPRPTPASSIPLPGRNLVSGAFTPLSHNNSSVSPSVPVTSPGSSVRPSRPSLPSLEIPISSSSLPQRRFSVPLTVPYQLPVPTNRIQVQFHTSPFFHLQQQPQQLSATTASLKPVLKVRKEITKKQREARQRNAAIAREVYRQKRLLGAPVPGTSSPKNASAPSSPRGSPSPSSPTGSSSTYRSAFPTLGAAAAQLLARVELKRTPSPTSPVSPLSPSHAPGPMLSLPSSNTGFCFSYPTSAWNSQRISQINFTSSDPSSSSASPFLINPQIFLSTSPFSAYERNLAMRKLTTATVQADLVK